MWGLSQLVLYFSLLLTVIYYMLVQNPVAWLLRAVTQRVWAKFYPRTPCIFFRKGVNNHRALKNQFRTMGRGVISLFDTSWRHLHSKLMIKMREREVGPIWDWLGAIGGLLELWYLEKLCWYKNYSQQSVLLRVSICLHPMAALVQPSL